MKEKKHRIKLSFILLFISTTTFCQHWDFPLSQIKYVNTIDVDSIQSIKIFNPVEGYCYVTKAFLTDNNLPGGPIDTSEPIPKCTDSCLTRCIFRNLGDSLFQIQFKWMDSSEFKIDTFYVFKYLTSYIAITKSCYYKEIIQDNHNFLFTPASSTDEREVVRICTKEEEIILHY